ncbi:hypothetical protein F3J28_22410, partial [Enterobacter sp. Ap-1006]|nr:hypothetical protein [Enterobacter sp. Ap-1006]
MHIRQGCNFLFINKPIFCAIKLAALSGIFMLAMMQIVRAATVDVTTEFIADLSQPQKNAFVNTTPVSGFCSETPGYCEQGDFSILIPGLTGEKYFDYASADLIKNHVSISLDGVTRDVVLTDPKTGNTL